MRTGWPPRRAQPELPFPAWPTDTFFDDTKEIYFNGEAVQMFHQPNAHTDGDIIVYFRKSDVVAAGDTFVTTTFPVINLAQGGSLNGIVARSTASSTSPCRRTSRKAAPT